MLLLASTGITLFVLTNCEVAYKDVETHQGTVRGYKVDDDEVTSFYGIPYATAPKGEDRYKAPLPPTKWNNTFNATASNIVCPQDYSGLRNVTPVISTLDCLVLNIFVPDTPKTNLSVYVYIIGGGYQNGYSNEYQFIDMAKRGIIMVSISYRLSVYGFLCLGTEMAPGNAGLKDQAAALKWIKKNIESFGGNSNSITLGGSSSAAGSVELQMLSPMSNGLFDRLIIESGSTLDWGMFTNNPLQVAERFAISKGENSNQTLEELENFFKSLTDDDMTSSFPTSYQYEGFLPCVESHNLTGVNKFIDRKPIDIIKKRIYMERPILTGFTLMEGLVLNYEYADDAIGMAANFSDYLPNDIEFESAEQKNEVAERVKRYYFPNGNITLAGHIDFGTDSYFNYKQYSSAKLHSQYSKPVYLYLFSFNGTVNLQSAYTSPIWGPGHVAQMLYIFKSRHPIMYEHMTKNDYLIQDRLRTMWYNFITHGKPIPAKTDLLNVDWEPLDTRYANYLNINLTMTVEDNPFPERFAFWDDIYGRSNPASRLKMKTVKKHYIPKHL